MGRAGAAAADVVASTPTLARRGSSRKDAAISELLEEESWTRDVLPTREEVDESWAAPERHPMVVYTDMGGAKGDTGDQVALFMLRGLETLGLVQARGIVCAGGGGRTLRALRRLHATLEFDARCLIGRPTAADGEGGDTDDSDDDDDDFRRAAAASPPSSDAAAAADAAAATVCSSEEVLRRAIEDRSLADYSLVLVVLGRLTELAAFLKKHGDAFALKVKHVALFGAVCEHRRDALIRSTRSFDGGPFDGGEDEHFLKPDPLHPNHAGDLAAAEYCYARLQQLAVPLVVVSKHAAYAAAVPATLYDDLARTNNPIARELRAEQRRGIDELWSRVNAPAGVGAPRRRPRGALRRRLVPQPLLPGDEAHTAEQRFPMGLHHLLRAVRRGDDRGGGD